MNIKGATWILNQEPLLLCKERFVPKVKPLRAYTHVSAYMIKKYNILKSAYMEELYIVFLIELLLLSRQP